MQRTRSVPAQLTLLSVLQRDANAAESLRISKSTLQHVQSQQQRQRLWWESLGERSGAGSHPPPPAASSAMRAALEAAAAADDTTTSSGRSAGRRGGEDATRSSGKDVSRDAPREHTNGVDHRRPSRRQRQLEDARARNSAKGGGDRGGGSGASTSSAELKMRRSATTGALDVIREASLDEELGEEEDLCWRDYWRKLDAWGMISSASSANSSPRSTPAVSPAGATGGDTASAGTPATGEAARARGGSGGRRHSWRHDEVDRVLNRLDEERERRERETERQRVLEAARRHRVQQTSAGASADALHPEAAAPPSPPLEGPPWPENSFHAQDPNHLMQPPEMWRVQAHGVLIGHEVRNNADGGWWIERWGQRRVSHDYCTGNPFNDYVRFGDKFGIDADGSMWSEWWLEVPDRLGMARGRKWGRKTNGCDWSDEWERR
ncbi:hypothetical protein CDCA_CDCA01G0129 [Cyanidium caldarium]|uniref:Uncharacterized protein n=1 Tax=Cyanidium caldarium TaxID=2771 RepID=A0AAV9IP51_CYACA|nr:hypothetical protein CDCA_CDCA01G0129 [Cyanidium caldarium]